jgi:hypothetical protein
VNERFIPLLHDTFILLHYFNWGLKMFSSNISSVYLKVAKNTGPLTIQESTNICKKYPTTITADVKANNLSFVINVLIRQIQNVYR